MSGNGSDFVRSKYLYNDKGQFLNIDAEDTICMKDSCRVDYYRNFAVAKESGKYDIYSGNLERLMLEADDYRIVGDEVYHELYGVWKECQRLHQHRGIKKDPQ